MRNNFKLGNFKYFEILLVLWCCRVQQGLCFSGFLGCGRVCGEKCIYPPPCSVGSGYFTENLDFVHTEKVEQGNEICCQDVSLKQWALQFKMRPWNAAIMTFHFFSVMLILSSFVVFWRQKVFILYEWKPSELQWKGISAYAIQHHWMGAWAISGQTERFLHGLWKASHSNQPSRSCHTTAMIFRFPV